MEVQVEQLSQTLKQTASLTDTREEEKEEEESPNLLLAGPDKEFGPSREEHQGMEEGGDEPDARDLGPKEPTGPTQP